MKISCDSSKMRLTDTLMRKRQPCSLIPATSHGCKKAPNPQKTDPPHTDVSIFRCLRLFLPFSNYDLRQLSCSWSRILTIDGCSSGTSLSFTFILGEWVNTPETLGDACLWHQSVLQGDVARRRRLWEVDSIREQRGRRVPSVLKQHMTHSLGAEEVTQPYIIHWTCSTRGTLVVRTIYCYRLSTQILLLQAKWGHYWF